MEFVIIEIIVGSITRVFRRRQSNNHSGQLPNFQNLDLSTLLDDVSQSIPMKPEVFCALRGGSRHSLDKMILDRELVPGLVDRQGNSILHIAAGSGNLIAVEHILSSHPSLMKRLNSNGETVLHVAACAGHLQVVTFLCMFITHVSGHISFEESENLNQIYAVMNNNKDTPLHVALKANHKKIASSLVRANPLVATLANNDCKSPLYMALESRWIELVKTMLRSLALTYVGSKPSFEGYSILHAAIKARNIDILDDVLGMDQSLIHLKDEYGRTCLSFAAFMGYYKEFCYLLEKSASHVYIEDDDGSFPIHMAVKNGHVRILYKLLRCFPDSRELVNKDGQNLLHIAAKTGSKALTYILEDDRGGKMIGGQDVNGNTPIQLATKHRQPRVVIVLVHRGKSNLLLKNNNGQTVMDIAEENMHSAYRFRERLILVALTYAYAPQRLHKVPITRNVSKTPDHKLHQIQANTLLLVATLLATIAFAAAFTIPGGYTSALPDLGMAALGKRAAFKVFMICDAVAMAGSLTALSALLWSHLGEVERIAYFVDFSLHFLGLALLAMPVGFLAGVFLIVSNLSTFSCVILVIAAILLVPLPFFMMPFYLPYMLLTFFGVARLANEKYQDLFQNMTHYYYMFRTSA